MGCSEGNCFLQWSGQGQGPLERRSGSQKALFCSKICLSSRETKETSFFRSRWWQFDVPVFIANIVRIFQGLENGNASAHARSVRWAAHAAWSSASVFWRAWSSASSNAWHRTTWDAHALPTRASSDAAWSARCRAFSSARDSHTTTHGPAVRSLCDSTTTDPAIPTRVACGATAAGIVSATSPRRVNPTTCFGPSHTKVCCAPKVCAKTKA